TLHPVLRDSLPHGIDAELSDELVRAVAGPAATDVWLCHFPLPPDGRGPDFQAWNGVHTGSGCDCRGLFRGGGRGGGTGPHAGAEFGIGWPGTRDGGHGAVVRSSTQMDPGAH